MRVTAVVFAIAFVAAHGAVLSGAAAPPILPATLFGALLAGIAVLKHLGLLAGLWAAVRRRFG